MEDLQLLITTGRAMRKYQKLWYLYHNRKDLAKALSLESQFDEILKRLPDNQPTPLLQKGLFQDDEVRF